METIFTVKNEDLARMSPQEAVDFFRELLWAEARRIGISIISIQISTRINVPDGGVDATIQGPSPLPASALAKAGMTSFQIKAGATFQPWQKAQIKNELFGDNPPHKDNLGGEVRRCLDNNGTYVLVCFKQDPTPQEYAEAKAYLNDYLKQAGYEDPHIEVIGQSMIIGFLKVFPSLALLANRRALSRFQTFQSWSKEAEMIEKNRPFKAGNPQQQLIQSIQSELRRNAEAIHLRVWGEPGIGKTRLILESMRAYDLSPLVIYCDSASKFRDSELMNEILKEDNQFSAILVIDECDADARSYIWNKLKYSGSRIKVITIYNEYDATSGNIAYIDTPPLDRERISQIIQDYGIPKDQADRWADFCSGSPRVAHVIGWNLKTNQEDLLKSPDTVNVWDRYVVGGDDPRSSSVNQRRLVLRHLALFKRFGFDRLVIAEAQQIATKVQAADPSITWARFQEIVQNLRERKILQGEYTLYITPKALHIRLWVEWWETYGRTFDLTTFYQGLSAKLIEWFQEMFRYAESSRAAAEIVKELLGPGGPFSDEN
jgi:hypothetical protein